MSKVAIIHHIGKQRFPDSLPMIDGQNKEKGNMLLFFIHANYTYQSMMIKGAIEVKCIHQR
jgi:hypothetical protein